MYRAWCVATGVLVAYYMSGDNDLDFRRFDRETNRVLLEKDIASKSHFKDLSDEELDKQIEQLRKKRTNSS